MASSSPAARVPFTRTTVRCIRPLWSSLASVVCKGIGDEELSGDLAIGEAASDEGENFELADGDAEALLLGCVWSDRRSRLGGPA